MNFRKGDEILLPFDERQVVQDQNLLPEHHIDQLLTKNKLGEYRLYWIMEDLGDGRFEVQDMWNETVVIRRAPERKD